MGDSLDVKVGKIQVAITKMEQSFSEFKNDTKEFHKHQSQLLDELAKDWQQVGRIQTGLADVQKQVNQQDEIIQKHKPGWERRDERDKMMRANIISIGWKVLGVILILFLVVILTVLNNDNILNVLV